jgi:thioredoxin-related protein
VYTQTKFFQTAGMKKSIITNTIGLLALLVFTITAVATEQPQTKNDGPTWSLPDAHNISHQFPQQAIENQQVTVLFFWATWCPYCKQLMPHIQSVLYQFQDSLNLKVYALNINEDADPQAYLSSQGYSFELFPKAEEVAEKYQIYGTPGILIFDQQGEQVFDLRTVQSKHLVKQKASHGAKSMRLAPYWAAEIRKALQGLLSKP